MKLVKDITLYSNETDNSIISRLKINSGILKIDKNIENLYIKDAYVPKNDWRDVSEDEYETLVKDSYDHYNTALSIHSLPLKLKKLFAHLKLYECVDRKEILEVFDRNKSIVDKINFELDSLIRLYTNVSYQFYGIATIPHGLETSSSFFYDGSGDKTKLLGMHFDKSQKFDINNLVVPSRNRIAINLGTEDRQLIFINLSVHKIKTIILRNSKAKNLNINNLLHYYFDCFKDYPVISITQKPYEFYIAPTDNFIHDGATIGCRRNNVLMTFLGFFNHKIRNCDE